MNQKDVKETEGCLSKVLNELAGIHDKVRKEMEPFVKELLVKDGSFALKGNEVVGWLGEMYVAQLLNGEIEDDNYSYDVRAKSAEGVDMYVEVKTRRKVEGKTGWRRTGLISFKEGEVIPSHLAFVKLNEDYSLSGIYIYPWGKIKAERIKEFKVKGTVRGYYFRFKDEDTNTYQKYPSAE